MAKFDRSRFKTSKSLAEQEKELASKIKDNSFGSSLPGWIEIKEDGEYLLRFWPTPVQDSYFMVPTMVHFLEMELDKYEDGKVVMDGDSPVREVRRGTVFNSRIHGDTEKDIVDEYIAFLEKTADELYSDDRDKRQKFLKHVYGYNEGGKYTGGITGVLDYVAYASLMKKDNNGQYIEKEFGRVRLRPSVRKGMLALSSGEDGDEGLSTDPFSDPDDGFIVSVVKDSVAGKKDPGQYYQVSWCTKNYIPVKWPLPEGFEDRYTDLPTLTDLYEGKYNSKDFSNALNGLQRFDEKHDYNVFSYDEFMDTCEELAELYPDDEEEEEKEEESKKPNPTPVKKKVAKAAPVEEEEDAPFEDAVESNKGTMSAADKLKQLQNKIKGSQS